MRSRKSCLQLTLVLTFVIVVAVGLPANNGLADLVQPTLPPIDTPGPIEATPIPPDLSDLRAPNAVAINRRTDHVLRVIWHDRTEVEAGYDIERRRLGDDWSPPTNDQWSVVRSFGPRSDWTQFSDFSVMSDTLYCYRVIAFNALGRLASPERCAYTRDGRSFPISRIQLKIKTADVESAGSDDPVSVLLTGTSPRVIPCCRNITWLNYSHDDFQRGDEFTYDLLPIGIRDMSDITRIAINKEGDGEWCVESIELIINERVAYQETFGGTASTCTWLGNDASSLVIPFRSLRDHEAWKAYEPIIPVGFDEIITTDVVGGQLHVIPFNSRNLGLRGADLLTRIEGIVGHELHGRPLGWRTVPPNVDFEHVTIEKATNQSVVVRLELEDKATGLANGTVEFDLNVALECVGSNQVDFSLTVSDIKADVQFLLFLDPFLNLVLDTIPLDDLFDFTMDETINTGSLGASLELRDTDIQVLADSTVEFSVTVFEPDPGGLPPLSQPCGFGQNTPPIFN